MYPNLDCKVVLVALFCLLALNGRQCDALAKLIKIPLTQVTTQEAGQLGQSVISHYSQISVGTPPKQFSVQFDLALSDSFLPHYSWNPFNTNLHYNKGFQCKSSATCRKTDILYTVEYQNCRLTGKPYEDQIALAGVFGQNNSTQVAAQPKWRQNFLAVSDASDARFKNLPIDGFIGLSLAAESHAHIKNILFSLKQANLIDNYQFSFRFNPILDSSYGGELILGGVDPDRYHDPIYWHHLPPLAPANQWALGLQYVSLGNQIVSCANEQCQVIFSSALSDSYGPRADVQRIYNLLGTVRQSSGLELIDCRRIAKLPILSFYVDGIAYSMYPSNYIRKTVNGRVFKTETCYVALLPSDRAREWTLGTNFLGAYYSIFDITYRQIGFATLK